MKKKLFRLTARVLLCSMGYQLLFPVYVYALTTGPSQPEVQSFEPIGTTEMVDMFTGDFSYNIPLLDVEGYPVNIFYQSGIGMEQEASWVGLGWNINPGEINRTVRGIPDDFNGETIETFTSIRPERDVRIGIGANFTPEIFGKNLQAALKKINVGISPSAGLYVNHNNYRGLSAGISISAGIQIANFNAGIGIGVGSQSGADVDFNASATISKKVGDGSAGVTGGVGVGFNSRSGLKDISLSMTPSLTQHAVLKKTGKEQGKDKERAKEKLGPLPNRERNITGNIGSGVSTTIPVGLQNYVPVITNKAYQSGFTAMIKGGFEGMGFLGALSFDITVSDMSYDNEGSRKGYGYLYAQNATRYDINDFSRDKDGSYNRTMKNLPAAQQTYDIYTVNGHGTGGMFRPFRNDIGTVYDPFVDPNPPSEQVNAKLELGFGNLFEIGGDVTVFRTRNECGPWKKMPFSKPMYGTLFENVFFRHAGDMAYNQQQDVPQLFNTSAQYLTEDLRSMKTHGYRSAGSLPALYGDNPARLWWDNTNIDRSSRSTYISWQTAEEAERNPELERSKKIYSYEDGAAGKFYDPKEVRYNRYRGVSGGNSQNARPSSLSEFTQTTQDGRRYVYGIPAMNNVSREVTFAVNESKANLSNGYVGFTPGTDDALNNPNGRDRFYSTTNTPAHAHSYLLTSVFSADYVDILGDGATDDDLGTFVKFNYTMTDKDYRWRTPYHGDTAQYNVGFWTDKQDGKGNYVIGSRQQWYLRSVESKNYVAEFYTSKRKDGLGVRNAILASGSRITNPAIDYTSAKSEGSYSYQLDSIKLYNKHDRYINKDNAIPVKTVIMQYDYSLCAGVPNNSDGGGKLTLKKLFVRYGNSQKNLLNPYVFSYNAGNPSYSFAAKDRWGNYKPSVSGRYNFEFPYTDQPDNSGDVLSQDNQLAAWNMTDIKLPSGGSIHVDYESDDYSFVQDKRAMQMMRIEGVGSGPALSRKNVLYHSLKDVNDYVYFKRRKSKERPGVSMKDNYLEGQTQLYYNFNLDVVSNGNYEYVKGYADIEAVDICSDNSDYAYIKLKRDRAGSLALHPATVYGINYGKYYMPHLFYDGYNGSSDLKQIFEGMIGSSEELVNMISGQNPFRRFINKQKAKYINLANSWIRIQTPCLTKRGGGIRVKQLQLSDNWQQLSGSGATATYGKQYDYTINDDRYGVISSGVASYEPMVGGDENPFRQPVPYTAEGMRGLPKTEFYQEEPFCEGFFPTASVGYSSVKVKSIHQVHSRSAQSVDENLFYTARDFPVRVDYTQKDETGTYRHKTLFNYRDEVNVAQGYSLVMNDMHGKAKAVNNYVIHSDGSHERTELVTGVTYNYNTSNNRLDNSVTTLVRQRGTVNTYALRNATLGMDMDFTVDTRERSSSVNTTTVELNLNVFMLTIFPVFPFTIFYSDKDKTQVFRSMTSTKVVQQYGILKSVDNFDHGARTKTENMVFDGETGGVLLTRTSNQYGDFTYNRKDPAYLAYEGMGPAYSNTGYEETVDSLVVDNSREGYLYTNHPERYTAGDELLVDMRESSGEKEDRFVSNPSKLSRLWITGLSNGYLPGRTIDYNVTFWKPATITCNVGTFEKLEGAVTITIYKSDDLSVPFKTGTIESFYNNTSPSDRPGCASANCIRFALPEGDYSYTVTGDHLRSGTYTQLFSIRADNSVSISLFNYYNYNLSAGIGPIGGTFGCKYEGPGVCRVAIPDSSGTKRCALLVAPRYKDRFQPGAPSVNVTGWPSARTRLNSVAVKIARSGRRNNLDQAVQETNFALPASTGALYSGITDYFGKKTSVLSVTARTFTDTAQQYAGVPDGFRQPGGDSFAYFNPYVLGLRGNFRPLSSYMPIARRSYDKSHSRYDGTYTISRPFWNFVNSATGVAANCNSPRNVFQANVLAGTLFWKNASSITRYDPSGNALEERDALGNYSAAQYGYNKSLPVAVGSNVRAQHFMFEGFEDYQMLLPQLSYLLYAGKDLFNPQAPARSVPRSDVSADYPSEQATTDASVFSRYGQSYNLKNFTAGGALSISAEASHTGYYSLKSTAVNKWYFLIGATNTDKISTFSLQAGQKYLLQLWARKTDGSPVTSGFTTDLSLLFDNNKDMKIKTAGIEGWYLLEAELDLSSMTAGRLQLNIPSGVYVDDIRFLPVSANMKSFVYDPIRFRLIAQLDENHMSTFYEYDQEGLLIRTKKETARGIMTISESRRANSKQQ